MCFYLFLTVFSMRRLSPGFACWFPSLAAEVVVRRLSRRPDVALHQPQHSGTVRAA